MKLTIEVSSFPNPPNQYSEKNFGKSITTAKPWLQVMSEMTELDQILL